MLQPSVTMALHSGSHAFLQAKIVLAGLIRVNALPYRLIFGFGSV